MGSAGAVVSPAACGDAARPGDAGGAVEDILQAAGCDVIVDDYSYFTQVG